jgi:hypothetical protein
MQHATRNMQLNRWAIAALILSIFAWAALLSPYYFTLSHDGRHSLFYQLEFLQGVADGRWFPRWGPDFGFGRGYPFYIFYSPATGYIVQAIEAWEWGGLVAAVKVAWLLGFLVGAAGAFRLAKEWWRDDRAAFIASLVYTYTPYKFVDIYVRGAFAEFWALALFPWVVLAFHQVVHHPRPRTIAKAALLYALLILTHTATALLFSTLMGILVLLEVGLIAYQRRQSQKPLTGTLRAPILAGGIALVLGVLNATIFWLPLLAEQRFIDVTQYVPANYNFANQFTEFWQFFSPFWGFDYAVPGPNDGMSFQLGVLPLLLVIAALWLLTTRTLERVSAARLLWAIVSLGVVVVVMTALAYPLWQNIPLAAMVQFPWRALGLSALLLSLIAGGGTVAFLRGSAFQQGIHPAVAIIALLAIVSTVGYATPRFTPPSEREETLATIVDFQRQYPDMAGRLPFQNDVPQFSSMEAQYDANEPLYKFQVISGTPEIQQTYYGGSTVRATITATDPATIELQNYDYPGWQLTLDGQPLTHRTHPPYGTIAFDVPPGTYTLVASFEDTPLRQTATWISILAFGFTLALPLFSHLKSNRDSGASISASE